jgi:hypothetical protein
MHHHQQPKDRLRHTTTGLREFHVPDRSNYRLSDYYFVRNAIPPLLPMERHDAPRVADMEEAYNKSAPLISHSKEWEIIMRVVISQCALPSLG